MKDVSFWQQKTQPFSSELPFHSSTKALRLELNSLIFFRPRQIHHFHLLMYSFDPRLSERGTLTSSGDTDFMRSIILPWFLSPEINSSSTAKRHSAEMYLVFFSGKVWLINKNKRKVTSDCVQSLYGNNSVDNSAKVSIFSTESDSKYAWKIPKLQQVESIFRQTAAALGCYYGDRQGYCDSGDWCLSVLMCEGPTCTSCTQA